MHELLFVHVPRTAGMAIRQALRLGSGELHTPAKVLRDRVGTAQWDSALTFGVVRNPWTRALSLYRHLMRARATVKGFRGWAEDGFPAPYRDGVRVSTTMTVLLTAGDVVLVDYLLEFEQLASDWAALRPSLQAHTRFEVPEELPRVNGAGHADLTDWYDGSTVHRVGSHYAEDARRFGYVPPAELTGL